jgi:hypothetical protein
MASVEAAATRESVTTRTGAFSRTPDRAPSSPPSTEAPTSYSAPAGEDLLVGLLTGLTALSKTSEAEIERLRRTPRQELREPVTPLGSMQMVVSAIDGFLPELLRDLVQALADPGATAKALPSAVDEVGELRASSGRWMLIGLRAAFEAGTLGE